MSKISFRWDYPMDEQDLNDLTRGLFWAEQYLQIYLEAAQKAGEEYPQREALRGLMAVQKSRKMLDMAVRAWMRTMEIAAKQLTDGEPRE